MRKTKEVLRLHFELGLRQREIAHLIQKNRAAVRQFELAAAQRRGARERTLLVPEQLRLQQLRWDGSAVHLHERAA